MLATTVACHASRAVSTGYDCQTARVPARAYVYYAKCPRYRAQLRSGGVFGSPLTMAGFSCGSPSTGGVGFLRLTPNHGRSSTCDRQGMQDLLVHTSMLYLRILLARKPAGWSRRKHWLRLPKQGWVTPSTCIQVITNCTGGYELSKHS